MTDDKKRESPLRSATRQLLSESFGVESITLEHIRELRKSRQYEMVHDTELGGRNLEAFEELTDEDVDAALAAVDDLVDEFPS